MTTTVSAPPSPPAVVKNLYPSLAGQLSQAQTDLSTLQSLASGWSGYTQAQINAAIQNDLLPIMERLVQGTLDLGNALGAITNIVGAAPS